ncbi:uncharacterized mitochondrial protein AtMg00810-like [Lotus japonicus]|uniref:uncharacterized mitochondrial protein AtMg00810-like n=1 Tax=Lotus japonicus TaxID=34305 RepID=UPI0025871C87|nr:uncharacterized mitochondrial protein AtMg00810-like [Lotus japonicus]
MHQPLGFRDSRRPDYVCRLKKSLYGLKQAPRAWYQRFADYVSSIGFRHSSSDHSLFIFRRGPDVAYILLYVDDIILVASSHDLRQSFMALLASEFSMKDLGPLSYFLGIAVTRHAGGLFLSQSTYASEIIARAGMASCNPSATPVDTKQKLSSSSGTPCEDASLYRSLAGALQYLTFTRPDISYAVQQVCLHMHAPHTEHMLALKRVLRYVRGTLTYGLHLYTSPIEKLVSYTDADWGGGVLTLDALLLATVFFSVIISFLGPPSGNPPYLAPVLKLNTGALLMLFPSPVGSAIYFWSFTFLSLRQHWSTVTMLVPSTYLEIQCTISVPNI